jgi:hypothetical protein
MNSGRAQLRTQLIVEQAWLELLDGGSRFLSNLLEAHPNQDGPGDLSTLDTGQAPLAIFKARAWLGLAVKLLNFPAQATPLVRGLGRILSQIEGGDSVRALGRKHPPEQFHWMTVGTICAGQRLAMLPFVIGPTQAIQPLVATLVGAGVQLAISRERAGIDLGSSARWAASIYARQTNYPSILRETAAPYQSARCPTSRAPGRVWS